MKFSLARFKAHAYITVENKNEGDHFYLIRKGRVKIFSSLSHDQELNRILGPGDFFEVISSMIGQPRLSSSQAIDDTELITVRKNQFGFLIQHSAPLALKIIRSFSNQLRRFDSTLVNKTLGTQKQEENPDMLFYQGEFYHNKGEHAIAAYIYTQYIKNFSYSELAAKAAKRLEDTDQAILSDITEAMKNSLRREYTKGNILFSEFEPGYEMFIIEKGRVNISKVIDNREVLIAVLKKGDIFGEMALLNNEHRSASAIATEDTLCMVLNLRNFNNVIKRNVILAVRIITLLSERIWIIYKQLDNFYFSDIKNRIYHTLFTQVQKQHIHTDATTSFSFDFGPKEMTNMLAQNEDIIMEAVDKILSENVVELVNNKFLCKNLPKLEKEVEFARKMELRKRKIEKSRTSPT